MLKEELDNIIGAVLTGQVQRYVVCIRKRINSGRSSQQSLRAVEMPMDDCVYERSKIVMIDKIDCSLVSCSD